VITTAASAIFSHSVSMSLFGGLLLTDSLTHILVAALLFVLAAVFLNQRADYVRLVAFFLGGVTIACALAILSFVGVTYLTMVVPSSLATLGYLAVLSLGIVGLLPLDGYPKNLRIALLITVLLSVVTLVFLNFSELWIALALIALFTAAFGFMRKESIVLPLVLSVIALVMILVGTRLPAFTQTSAEVRPNVSTSLAPARAVMSSSRAILGTGPGTYAATFAKSRPMSFNQSPFWGARFDQGVSFFATIPVTVGLLGSVAWLLLIGAAISLGRRKLSDPVIAVAGLTLAFTGVALLTYTGSFTEIIIGALALGVLVGAAGQRRDMPFSSPNSWKLFGTFLALVIVAAGSLAGVYVLGQKYAAAAYYGSAAQAMNAGDVDTAIAKLSRAGDLDRGSDVYQRGLSQALLAQFQKQSATSTEGQQRAQSLLSLAVQTAEGAVKLNPDETANWGNLGGIYEGLTPYVEGVSDKAFAAYDEAASRDPQNPGWALARARVYGALAQYQNSKKLPTTDSYAKAQEEIKKALGLKSDFADAKFLSAQYLLANGDVNGSIDRAKEIISENPNDASLAFQVGLLFYQNDQLAPAQSAFERAVVIADTYSDARYFLGLTYSRENMEEKALEQFRAVSAQNPENNEVKKIIENLQNGRPVLEGLSTADKAPAAASSTTEVAPIQ
jgi:tetratricopeptide (TPR) repeat protein